tara:strand:+ start:669 stop:1073 length:405 start_codon:yes stop_codon:yes gene_type:complete
MSGPFKMKGFGGFGNESPAKQLKPEYMRSEEAKELFSSPKGTEYDIKKGIRGPGVYVEHKKTGKVKGVGMPTTPKPKKGTSKKIGPAESSKAIEKKWADFDKARRDAESSRWGTTAESRKALDVADEASKYKKR